jgi:hypothetical protein
MPFRFCTAEAISIIAAHLEALNDFLRLIGAGPHDEVAAHHARVAAWQQEQAMRFPTRAIEFEDASGPGS